MALPDPPPPPEWVARPVEEVVECYRVLDRGLAHGLDARDRGALGALEWLTIGEVSPMTERGAGAATWDVARAESWVALCVAAGKPPPTDEDWRRLGVEPRPAVTDDREYAYGAWRALAWLLGVRDDWPTYTSWHRAAEIPRERPHMAAPRSARDTEAWRAADQASRDQAERDALRHWRHVRQLADATASR